MNEHHETVVIGGGQAGLSMGYHLAQRGRGFVILDANDRVGDAWRNRWDSLRLFTPAKFDGLNGMRFDAPRNSKPTKDEMADYLESYAERFRLPIRKGVRVDALSRRDGRFVVSAGEETFTADRVVVANGAYQIPRVPAFASDLDPSIRQMHSVDYRGPSQLQPGGALIVGVGNSGGDISLEVAREHKTWLAGKETAHLPFDIDSRKAAVLTYVVRFVGRHVLTLRTPIGRKIAPKFISHAAPLIRVKPKDFVKAGIERVPRVAGVEGGKPVLADGRTLDVANVIWCTGFVQEWPWIDLPAFDEHGKPLHSRGIVEAVPGLYFLGLKFQFAAVSDTLPGVGRDAAFIARHIARTSANVLVG